MEKTRMLVKRLALVVLWFGSSVGAIGGLAYPAVSLWLERHTVLLEIVDCNGDPVANAEVSRVPVTALTA